MTILIGIFEEERVEQFIRKGVHIPTPLTIDVGNQVDIDQISGNGVKIYPGYQIYGEKTLIFSGVQLGYEAPVTMDNWQLGTNVELKRSVFLEKPNMGLGGHVREACLLEDQGDGAHGIQILYEDENLWESCSERMG